MLLFSIWNLKNAITYKCERVVLSRASVYFAIGKLILLFSLFFFHVPCIILSNVYIYIVRSMFPSFFNRSQSNASVVNQMSYLFLKPKKIFLLFSTFWKWSYSQFIFDFDQGCETQRLKWQHCFEVVWSC